MVDCITRVGQQPGSVLDTGLVCIPTVRGRTSERCVVGDICGSDEGICDVANEPVSCEVVAVRNDVVLFCASLGREMFQT